MSLSAFLEHPVLQALGWTLLHSLWQGAALGLLAWVGLRLLRGRGPGPRYALACAGLGLMLALPVATWWYLTDLEALRGALRPALPWAVGFWLLGVAFMALRLTGGWIWMQRLRGRWAEPASAHWQLRVGRLAQRMAVQRPIRLLKSLAVDAPMVIGWLKPVILIPASCLANMDPEALEAILAHELAHIRRQDYLVNLLQSAVEALLFYHPAAWWLSRQIRLERENCCDDAAVAHCGDPVRYARALAGLEDLRHSDPSYPTLALAANGGILMNRIQRLILPKLPPSSGGRAGLLAILAVSALGGTISKLLTGAELRPHKRRGPTASSSCSRPSTGPG